MRSAPRKQHASGSASPPSRSVTFAGSPLRYLPGASRPNALVPIEQAVTSDWTIGPNRFPTSAQNPYLNIQAFAYPAVTAWHPPRDRARNAMASR